MTPDELTGIVLCGGKSSRFGQDKALFVFEGEQLFRRVARRLEQVCVQVLLAPGQAGRFGEHPYREVADVPEIIGPLAGLVAGLEAAKTDLVALVGVDMPFCDPALLRACADRLQEHLAVVPVDAAGPQPLHAVYRKAAAARLRSAGPSLRRALQSIEPLELGTDELDALNAQPRFAFNLNAPQDLADL